MTVLRSFLSKVIFLTFISLSLSFVSMGGGSCLFNLTLFVEPL